MHSHCFRKTGCFFWATWAKTRTGESSYLKGLGLDFSHTAASAVCGQRRGGQVQGTAVGCCRRGCCHRVLQEGMLPWGAAGGASMGCGCNHCLPQRQPQELPRWRQGQPWHPRDGSGARTQLSATRRGAVRELGSGRGRGSPLSRVWADPRVRGGTEDWSPGEAGLG